MKKYNEKGQEKTYKLIEVRAQGYEEKISGWDVAFNLPEPYPADPDYDGLTADERGLARLINDYRQSKGLTRMPVSKSLTKVARYHVIDTILHKPYLQVDSRGIQGNGHSWSANGPWTPVVFTGDHKYAEGMWSKPRELSSYLGNGFEISAGGVNPAMALASWQGSAGHNNVILTAGEWKGLRVMGVAINRGASHVWFGIEDDPAGYFY